MIKYNVVTFSILFSLIYYPFDVLLSLIRNHSLDLSVTILFAIFICGFSFLMETIVYSYIKDKIEINKLFRFVIRTSVAVGLYFVIVNWFNSTFSA